MSNRDEFPERVKKAVALRAGYCCSFEGCGKSTVGPSAESAMSFALIGQAAHIHAAAPGGRRYLEAMTPEQRSHIDNAIWLCDLHAKLVDRDEVTYTAEGLRRMKLAREAQCELTLRAAERSPGLASDLIAIGPDVVCAGSVVTISETTWDMRLKHFVIGDTGELASFIDGFQRSVPSDRYVLVNEIGDGRQLAGSPILSRDGDSYVISCRVLPSFPRIAVQELPEDPALSSAHDFMLTEDGNLAVVARLEALPQKVKTCLSHQKGESPFHPEFGTRFAEYYDEFRASLWLTRLLKLEVIRQASIPYGDPVTNSLFTPLHCVERVYGIEALATEPSDQWLPIGVDFEVKGVGRWKAELSALIPASDEWRRRAEEHGRAFYGLPYK